MNVFVDTSAILAVLDADDLSHDKARKIWKRLISEDAALFSTDSVLYETFALIQNRMGMTAARIFADDILPLVQLKWAGEALFGAGLSIFLSQPHKKLSLVDCISFETMRQTGLKKAFAFDSDFQTQGFDCLR